MFGRSVHDFTVEASFEKLEIDGIRLCVILICGLYGHPGQEVGFGPLEYVAATVPLLMSFPSMCPSRVSR
jgi:hypothetical protein